MGSGVGDIVKAALPAVAAAVTTAAGFPEAAPWVASGVGGVEGATGPNGSPLGAVTGAIGGYGSGTFGSGLYTGGSALAHGASLGDAFAAGFPQTASTLGIGSNLAGDAATAFNNANAADAGVQFGGGALPWQAPGLGPVSSGITGAAGAGGIGGAGGSSFSSLPLGSIMSGVSGLTNAAAINSAENQMKKQQQANLALEQPYLNEGNAAVGNLSGLLNPGTSAQTLTQTPGYQFELGQGTQAMNNAAAAGGMLGSGQALKAAQQFGQGLAGTTFNTAVGQQMAAAGLGQNAVSGATGVNTNIGNIQAGGTMGQANNLTNTLAGIANPQNAAIAALLRSLSGQPAVA